MCSIGLVVALVELGVSTSDVVLTVPSKVHYTTLLTHLLSDKDLILERPSEHIARHSRSAIASEGVPSNSTEAHHSHSRVPSQEHALEAGRTEDSKGSAKLGQATHVLKLDAQDIELLIGELFRAVEQLL